MLLECWLEIIHSFSNWISNRSYENVETASGYGSIIPNPEGAESHPLTKALGEKVGNYVEEYIEAMEKVTTKLYVLFPVLVKWDVHTICTGLTTSMVMIKGEIAKV